MRNMVVFLVIWLLIPLKMVLANELSPEQMHKCVQATVKVGALDTKGNPSGTGSGTMIDPRGYILTNFHVVEAVVNGQCLLRYPDRGHSTMTATVKFICPALDVAILAVDPHGTHPMWFDSGDIRDFIEQIPNLPLETKKPIKGNSQPVMAIGFPNASQDYQLCKG